jgi:hypothetical protein
MYLEPKPPVLHTLFATCPQPCLASAARLRCSASAQPPWSAQACPVAPP